ncbi:MAG: M23 family metallopeptidase [Desulfurellaceae bacterium]|nr:M23 family metallopeptidase [Desulfurellaceae bacterium]
MGLVLKGGVPLLLLVAVLYWNWDGSPPVISWPSNLSESVGGQSPITVRLLDSGKGLASVSVVAVQADTRTPILTERIARPLAPWASGTLHRELTFSLDATPGLAAFRDGSFSVEVRAEDHANWWLFSRSAAAVRTFELDRTPPRVILLSTQHRIRQGGAELIRYRTSPDTQRSGVTVGERSFRGYRQPTADSDEFVCLFALGHNDPVQIPISVWAEDHVGNRTETTLAVFRHNRRFRQRTITISDRFIDTVLAEVIRQSKLPTPETQLERFLLVNAELRRQNDATIEEIAGRSVDHVLWSEAFSQLSNSQVEARYADHRAYVYQGQEVDQQTHLGFDLASTSQGPVEAANAGTVVYTAYLGIYGNCVILDHGLGLMSLYAHLSQIDVAEGQQIQQGEMLGRTGKTGLAGGDHLHFAILVQGVPVTPLEWWDADWVQTHFFSRLRAAAG